MHRISRYRLFNMLVSDIRFDKQLKNRVPDPALYEIIDRLLDRVCSTAVMVVQASRPDDDHYSLVGHFGRDEPWPDWVSQQDLALEGLEADDQTRPKDEM
jgi:hypothetical protein